MTNAMSLNCEIQISTKDRPEDLKVALDSILIQTVQPNRVLIIDSSTNPETQNLASNYQFQYGLRIDYIRSLPGLTRQRNAGLNHLLPSTEIVHFIDDDSELLPDYLEEMHRSFNAFQYAVGIGGSIQNLEEPRIVVRRRLFGLDSKHQGKVLSSGMNTMNRHGTEVRPVDWVSGCAMSFRRFLFATLTFDELRDGNSIGEDVDFCLRAQKYGQVLWNPNAKLFHHKSTTNRLTHVELRLQIYRHRLLLAESRLGGVKKTRVLLAEYVQSIFTLLGMVTRHNFRDINSEITFWRRRTHV